MRILICVTLIARAYAQEAVGRHQYVTEHGPLHMVLDTFVTKCVHNNRSVTTNPDLIYINFNDYLNNINVSFPIKTAAESILSLPGLDTTKKFVFIIPGFTHGITAYSMSLIEESFKALDTYVMFLNDPEYTNIFKTKNVVVNYEEAVTHSTDIAKMIADFFVVLSIRGVSPNNIHAIGHSIGGHIAGKAAYTFYVRTGLMISRVTALDPCGPCFEDLVNHVRRGQAVFVDVYHSNANELASSKNEGDANVVVNNGIVQPKCFPASGSSAGAAAAMCSHMSCQNFFFMTVIQKALFPATKCESYKKYKMGECKNNEQINSGYWIPTNASGVYYTSTGDNDIYHE